MRTTMFVAAALAGASLAAAPILAEAQARERVLVCDRNVKKKANTGTVIGAIGGGLLGRTVAGRGDKTEGTLIGAGVGAVAGHQIAKSDAKKKRCHYVYR